MNREGHYYLLPIRSLPLWLVRWHIYTLCNITVENVHCLPGTTANYTQQSERERERGRMKDCAPAPLLPQLLPLRILPFFCCCCRSCSCFFCRLRRHFCNCATMSSLFWLRPSGKRKREKERQEKWENRITDTLKWQCYNTKKCLPFLTIKTYGTAKSKDDTLFK